MFDWRRLFLLPCALVSACAPTSGIERTSTPPQFAANPAAAANQPIPGKPDRALPGKPNFLFIAVDDLNDWVVPFQGAHAQTITPNFARLAAMGVRFENAHTPATVCNPARIALLTGLHPAHTGVYANRQQPMRDFLPDAVTLFEHFDNAGYHVAGTGKHFHNPDNVHQRWDRYFRPLGNPRPTRDQYPLNGLTDLTDWIPAFDWGPLDEPAEAFIEYKMSSFGIDFLQEEHEAPFVLAIGYQLPHLSWYMPRENWDRIPERPDLSPHLANDRDDMEGRPANHSVREHGIITADGDDKWHEAIRAYLASVNYVDDQLGRLLDGLASSAYSDNTIIILWSDHGWHLGEKDAWRKFTLWERSSRVPFIIARPGTTDDGKSYDGAVTLLDIFPTMTALADLDNPAGLGGKSLVRVLDDPGNARVERDYILTSMGFGSTLRSDRWRYTFYRDGSEELYDEIADPNEWTNLASDPQHAARMDQFRKAAARLDFAEQAERIGGSGGGE